MSKHSGENTLLQIFNNIKAKVDYLVGLINAKQEPFIITATADFQSGVLTNVSHTFAEITDAYERGDHIFLDLDASQMDPGLKVIIALVSFVPEQHAMFEQIMYVNGSTHVTGMILADGSSNFSFTLLVPQTSTGGLTFIVSDTVPTVDDRSIITFVVEE